MQEISLHLRELTRSGPWLAYAYASHNSDRAITSRRKEPTTTAAGLCSPSRHAVIPDAPTTGR
jgi:hypothetical protein